MRGRVPGWSCAAICSALLALALAPAGCETDHACRSGTLFVNVDLGPFNNVNQVDVSVSVAGATPTTTSLRIPAGAHTGGIEIDFPHGYPAGKTVQIDVTSMVAGMPVATHSTTVTPASGCQTVDFSFSGFDAVTGTGGAAGSSAGADGRGGAAGTSAAGTSGLAGTSAGGFGGATGGSIGGSTGGSLAGRGGSGGTCMPTGAENCFNGKDDDCDGYPDCADTDCGPVAQCATLDATGAKMGLVVPSGMSCPTGYTDVTAIYAGTLTGGACSGCSCRPPTVTACTTTISSYGTAADCANLSNPGTQEIALSSTQVCTTPSWTGSMFGQVYGVQVTTFTPVISGSCVASGVATPGPSSWSMSYRFCSTATLGVGCGTGQVCIPNTTSQRCAMYDGPHTCQPGTTYSTYYTGYTDSRTCSSCSCGSPTGQGCSAMRVNVGTDYTCSPNVTATLSSGGRFCYSGNGVYSPGVVFTGSPTQPTSCPAISSPSGGLSPTGAKVVCCL